MSKQDLNNMLLCKWKWHRFKPVGLHVGLYQGHSSLVMYLCMCVCVLHSVTTNILIELTPLVY